MILEEKLSFEKYFWKNALKYAIFLNFAGISEGR
jgi:hypothetical protein